MAKGRHTHTGAQFLEYGVWIGVLLLLVVFAVLAIVLFGRAAGTSPAAITYGIPRSKTSNTAKLPKPKSLKTEYRTCRSATVLSGNSIALRGCASPDAFGVVILNVDPAPISSPLGTAAKEALNALMQTALRSNAESKSADKQKIYSEDLGTLDCKPLLEPAEMGVRYKCTVGALDLGFALVASGLATVTPGEISPQIKQLAANAREAGAGIWWDWKSTGGMDYDPVVWRGERDATLSNAESAMANRWQVISSLVSSGLTLVAGAALGFLASWLRERSSLSKAINYVHGEIKPALELVESAFKQLKDALNMSPSNRQLIGERIANSERVVTALDTKVNWLKQLSGSKGDLIPMGDLDRMLGKIGKASDAMKEFKSSLLPDEIAKLKVFVESALESFTELLDPN